MDATEWIPHTTKSGKILYYINPVTGECKWQRQIDKVLCLRKLSLFFGFNLFHTLGARGFSCTVSSVGHVSIKQPKHFPLPHVPKKPLIPRAPSTLMKPENLIQIGA